MINVNVNYGNIVKINCFCTEEQAEILDNYFYGQVNLGFDEQADYQVNYKGNINNRRIKKPENWKPEPAFRNPSYVCIDTSNRSRIAYASDQGFNSRHIVVKKQNEFNFYDEERPGDTLIAAIVREIVVRKLLELKFFPLHSASFSDGENAVVIFGHRKAGKSSTMIYETICKGYNMVANDIQFVGKLGGQWVCASIPYDVTVGGDLLNAIGINAEIGKEKLRFTPKQFCEQFGVGQQWMVPIKYAVNTKLDLSRDDYTIEQIEKNRRATLYQEQSREDWTYGDPYNISGDFVFDYDGLAKDVPLFRVEGRLLEFFKDFDIRSFDYSKIGTDGLTGSGNNRELS